MPRIPLASESAVLESVTPVDAIARVRDAFVAYAEGRWTMPPKVYLDSPPHGDFRAMPALGDGLAILKWVTSFPTNPTRGLPTVTGTILVSDAGDGRPLAIVDGRSVTALRTGAAAAVATRALAPAGASSAGLIGCGLHGLWAGRCLAAEGFESGVCNDAVESTAQAAADTLGWSTGSKGDALACDVVTTVTPGHSVVIGTAELRAGLHINALGADGPGKAELAVDAVIAAEVFCDEWEQASHGGELRGAVESGALPRERVTELGAVLTGAHSGRSGPEATTLFDSTGLAIQDLAIAHAVLEAIESGLLKASVVEL